MTTYAQTINKDIRRSTVKEETPENEKEPSERTERSVEKPQDELPEIICPVCGRPLEPYNIPTVEVVIKDELRFLFPFRFRIVNCKPLLEYDFAHADEGPKKTSHRLTAVIKTEFDDKGNCTVFDIIEVLPGKKRKR